MEETNLNHLSKVLTDAGAAYYWNPDTGEFVEETRFNYLSKMLSDAGAAYN